MLPTHTNCHKKSAVYGKNSGTIHTLKKMFINSYHFVTGFTLSHKDFFLYISVLLFIVLNLMKIFNNDFWNDEAYSIILVKKSVFEIIVTTAGDVHPPLYYFILKLFCEILGYKPWIYGLVSLLPFIFTLIFAIREFRKEFGFTTAYIFIILQSLSSAAIIHNSEVRMYSWGLFFVLLCAYSAYKIICGQNKSWLPFTIFGLCGAYTHYYALISIAFIYITLFLVLIVRNKRNLKNCLISGFITVVLYFPWLLVLINTLQRVNKKYWITEITSISSCYNFLFEQGIIGIVTGLIFVISFIGFISKNRTLRIPQKGIPKPGYGLSDKAILIIICVLSIIGTLSTGLIVSALMRPVMQTRYLYPCAGLLWLALAVSFPKVFHNKILHMAFILILLLNCTKIYAQDYMEYTKQKNMTAETVKYLDYNLQSDNILVTDIQHLTTAVLDYYYPDNQHMYVSKKDVWLSSDKTTYMLISSVLTPVQIKELNEAHKEYEFIMQSMLTNHTVFIYKIKNTK